MSKYVRKYRKGKRITSLEELYKQDFVYVFDKITHRGWFGSWQIRFAQQCINRGILFYAHRKDAFINLPCMVGDTLYYVNKYRPTPRIEENKVHTIEMLECKNELIIRIWTQHGVFYENNMPDVFKTRFEAEQRLKELQNDR